MLPMISVTWINDSQCTYSVVFSTCYAQFNITTTAVTDTSFGQQGTVLCFRFPPGWAVVGKDDQFCFALSEHFQSLLVPNCIHSTFHKQLEHSAEWPQGLLHLLCGHRLSTLGAGSSPTKSSHKMAREQERCVLYCYMNHVHRLSILPHPHKTERKIQKLILVITSTRGWEWRWWRARVTAVGLLDHMAVLFLIF